MGLSPGGDVFPKRQMYVAAFFGEGGVLNICFYETNTAGDIYKLYYDLWILYNTFIFLQNFI